jgi:hypothetical protein
MPITSLDQVTEFPLCWPEGKPRAARRQEGNPHGWNATLAAAHQKIEDEMRRMGARGYVISMSPRHKFGSRDPGCAVWWNQKKLNQAGQYELRVIACDAFDKAEVNLYAIGLTLDRMRAIERYGAYTSEQAFEGARQMLPPPPGSEQTHWTKVLGMENGVGIGLSALDRLAIAERRYRQEMANAGADEKAMVRFNLAIAAARKELKGNG